jgi:hypothetical protein
MTSPTRREVLVWLPAAFALVRCGPQLNPAQPPPLRFLTDTEALTLKSIADQVLPPDGSNLGAVPYVDALLSAFDDPTPRVFLSPLYEPIPLDRVSERAWRLRLYGSDGVQGGAPNDAIIGKTIGLRQQVRDALAAAKTTSIEQLTDDQRELLADLVTQASFAQPAYGGNPGGAGWKMIGSAGAVLPGDGYVWWDGTKNVERADAPDSTPEPGVDDQPMDDTTRQLLTTVAVATGGQVASS